MGLFSRVTRGVTRAVSSGVRGATSTVRSAGRSFDRGVTQRALGAAVRIPGASSALVAVTGGAAALDPRIRARAASEFRTGAAVGTAIGGAKGFGIIGGKVPPGALGGANPPQVGAARPLIGIPAGETGGGGGLPVNIGSRSDPVYVSRDAPTTRDAPTDRGGGIVSDLVGALGGLLGGGEGGGGEAGPVDRAAPTDRDRVKPGPPAAAASGSPSLGLVLGGAALLVVLLVVLMRPRKR